MISFPLLLRYFWLKEQVFRIEKILKITEESQKEALNKHKRLLDSFFTETVLKEILKFDIVVRQLSDIEYFHAIFQEKISQKCAEIDSILIRENRLTEKELYAALTEMESSLSEKIIPHEAHYYWNGHIIFDKLLMPLFQQIRGKMVEAAAENMGELFKKFRNKAMEFDLKTKLKEAYKMSFEEIEHNPFMQKMREDIRYAGF